MYRKLLDELRQWKNRPSRKPLVICGARQVGKTWLVRELARLNFENFVEINFDETPEKQALVEGRRVEEAVNLIALDREQSIKPGKTLVFFDEIQAAPNILARLRYFFEKMPNLHVIAAGSLLDFALAEHDVSMPVGRIEYLFMGPMSFSEFLIARGRQRLSEFLDEYEADQSIPAPIHQQLMDHAREYFVVGGMPAVIRAYTQSRNWNDAYREQRSILQTFTDDFAKYGRRIDPHRLRKTFIKMPLMVGKKLKYAHIDRGERAKNLAFCVEMLEMARIVYRVRHSTCNGIPLGAEVKGNGFKPLFLDIGLMCGALGLKLTDLHQQDEIQLVNKGPASEQFIGQHLLYSGPGFESPELFYWKREQKSSSAEVDYVSSATGKIVPVEVKAGKSGTLRSMNMFMFEKKLDFAIRFDANPPSRMVVRAVVPAKGECRFTLLSLPLYMVEQFRRLGKAGCP